MVAGLTGFCNSITEQIMHNNVGFVNLNNIENMLSDSICGKDKSDTYNLIAQMGVWYTVRFPVKSVAQL